MLISKIAFIIGLHMSSFAWFAVQNNPDLPYTGLCGSTSVHSLNSVTLKQRMQV